MANILIFSLDNETMYFAITWQYLDFLVFWSWKKPSYMEIFFYALLSLLCPDY